jgi:hypothetical protein
MKRTAGILLMAAVLALSLAYVSQANADPDPLVGGWESIDIDGSSQDLKVGRGPGATYRMVLTDDGATICGLDPVTGDILYAAQARGFGTLSGSVISGSWDVFCFQTPHTYVGTFAFTFTYDAVANTLTDNLGVVWTRH